MRELKKYEGNRVILMACSKCNVACKHCYIGYSGNRTPAELKTLAEYYKNKYKLVRIDGAEPLVDLEYLPSYKIVGQDVSGLDGFYDHVWKEYGDIGIQLPENPSAVCNEIKDKLGISCMIVDANDLGQEILAKSDDIELDYDNLKQIIRDNPAGQGRETTPLILIRKKN